MTDPLQPVNCACFNLRRAARQITQNYDRALRSAEIQAGQFSILVMIAHLNARDGITMSALAERLGMDRTTLTRNIGPIQRHGWIETAPGEDRRERLVAITDAGRAKLDEALPLWHAAQAATVDAIGPAGLDGLLSLTRRIATG